MSKSKSFLQNLIKPFLSNSSNENEDDLERIAAREQKNFSFEVLVAATKNFHPANKLGEGGFGPVYKGKLSDGREIAVKKLSHSSSQGKKEFMNEAKLLARVQHRNVVNLLGYCAHGPEKLLVYEYVVNESLDKLLFKLGRKEELNWKRRHDLITGIAKGLLYLHEDAHICIIHRDIKGGNILLDEKWVPKIADFGMARLYSEDQTHVNTRVAGTNGYMAPEYLMHGQLSVKADVFSFGVVVLELITGQKNSTFYQDPDCQSMIEWRTQWWIQHTAIDVSYHGQGRSLVTFNAVAYKMYKKGRSLDIMDPVLAPSAVPDEIAMCIQIGLLCTQSDPRLRPTMRRVVVMLSKKPGSIDEEPTRPGYPGSRYRRSHRPTASSSTAGTSGASNSNSNVSTTNSNTVTVTGSTLTLTSPRLDTHGKRPAES